MTVDDWLSLHLANAPDLEPEGLERILELYELEVA